MQTGSRSMDQTVRLPHDDDGVDVIAVSDAIVIHDLGRQ